MSYFGGLPIVPDDFDWPTIHDRQGLLERLTFMAQVDCADLPAGPGKGPVSRTRVTSISSRRWPTAFGPDAAHFVVRYEPRQATQTWEPLDMPFTGTIEPDDPMDVVWRGKRTHYDRVEIEFGWIEEPTDDEVAARAARGTRFQGRRQNPSRKARGLLSARRCRQIRLLSVYQAPKDALWTPYAGFPVNWKTARILRKFVEAYHREETEDVAKPPEGVWRGRR